MVDIDVTTPGAFEAALFNPYLQEVRANPWPLCHQLREVDPVFPSPFGFYAITGYEEALSVLRDPRFSVDPRNIRGLPAGIVPEGTIGPGERGLHNMMLFTDPPDHTRLRSLVGKAFTPRVVARMKESIDGIVDGLLDEVAGAEGFDVMANLAYPLPVTVICDLLGIPGRDREPFRAWAQDVAPILDPMVPAQNVKAVADAGVALLQYFEDLIAERRKNLGEDLLSELIRAEEAGDKLTLEELRATCILLLIAGHETTMNLIGNGFLALLRNPEELARLRYERDLMRTAIEELLRHDGPAILTARVALEDVSVGRHTIEAGRVAIVLIGAANRDPDHFPDPDRLDVERTPNKHLSFGAGPHFCVGAPLARVEASAAIGKLLDRFPRISLADEPIWRTLVTFRGLESLPVAV